jgi:AAA15 family ATPase/GTPase
MVVIDSLRLIENSIERIFFIGNHPRIPVCRINGYERPMPLHGMGDGVSRLFELILGIVNVAGGICLIDEFENGLHWSVQEKIWEVIFQTSRNLDVQIFATTHSFDAVKAFQTIALQQEEECFGGMIQMKKQNGKTVAKTIFDTDIKKVLQYEVEVR